MFSNYTDRARKALENARQEAIQAGDEYIDSTHLLLALAKDPESKAGQALQRHHIGYELLQKLLKKKSDLNKTALGSLPFSPICGSLLQGVADLRIRNGYPDRIGTEHLLLTMLSPRSSSWLHPKILKVMTIAMKTQDPGRTLEDLRQSLADDPYEMLDEAWNCILHGPLNQKLEPHQIAAALLPLFHDYVAWDQQESSSMHQRYLLLGKLKTLARKKT